MRRPEKIPLTTATALLCLCFAISACTSRSPSPAPAIASPTGKYQAITSVEHDQSNPTRYLCVIVQINDSTGRQLFKKNTGASDRMNWSLAWDGDDKLIFRSSDSGTYTIQRQADGTWVDNLPAPPP